MRPLNGPPSWYTYTKQGPHESPKGKMKAFLKRLTARLGRRKEKEAISESLKGGAR